MGTGVGMGGRGAMKYCMGGLFLLPGVMGRGMGLGMGTMGEGTWRPGNGGMTPMPLGSSFICGPVG